MELYHKGCNANDIPGASCQAPDCDCAPKKPSIRRTKPKLTREQATELVWEFQQACYDCEIWPQKFKYRQDRDKLRKRLIDLLDDYNSR
jgi:hypothetical protein